MTKLNFSARHVGQKDTLDYKVFIEKDGVPVSPFHDIPLTAPDQPKIFNMVVEIPRWTNAKLEISKTLQMNPIVQDIKKGKLRYVKNCFPHHGYIWNYGALPQTWEDPRVVDSDTKAAGDNDPVDVCEIGERVAYVGQVKQVKALGVLALLDEGETDWKIIAIDVTDPLADKLNDIEDVEKHLPGLLKATHEWFRIYKMPDGKPENNFAFGGEAKNREYAHKVIHETHEAWARLISGEVPNKGDKDNVTVEKSPYKLSKPVALEGGVVVSEQAKEVSEGLDKWHFVGANL